MRNKSMFLTSVPGSIRYRPGRDAPVDDPDAGGASGGGGSDDGNSGDGNAAGGDTSGDDGPGRPPTIDGEFDAERAKRAIAAARAAEKSAKDKAKAAAADLAKVTGEHTETLAKLKADLAKALGLGDADEDPKVLAERAAAAQKEAIAARDQAVADLVAAQAETAVVRAAAKAKADAEALLDSASFRSKLAKLEPALDGFAEQLAELIAETVKANPRRYGTEAAVVVQRSSGDHTPAGQPARKRPTSLGGAVAGHYR